MSESIESAVRDAEKARCAAMLAGDAAALDGLLDPRLAFHHSNGLVDDKPTYLAKMAAGRITYVSIAWEGEKVIPLGAETALLTGRMTNLVKVEGVEKTLDNRVLAAWSLGDEGWRMIAFQSTPLQ